MHKKSRGVLHLDFLDETAALSAKDSRVERSNGAVDYIFPLEQFNLLFFVTKNFFQDFL